MKPDARAPLRIAAYTVDPWQSACPVLRITGPCEMAGLVVLRGTHWVGDGLLSEPDLVGEADVVVIQREFPRFWDKYASVVAHARARGLPVIYDLDDLLFGLPETHPDWRHFQDARAPMLRAMLEADAVTASTPALCAALSAYRDNVNLLPNTLDDRFWPLNDGPSALTDGPVVIGYMGGHTHRADVALIGPALRRVAERFSDRVVIRFMGRTPPPEEVVGLPNVTWDRTTILDYAGFARWFAAQRLDIGLAPLEDTPFNRGKSGIKFLEYTAIGAASLCSRVPAYADTMGDGEGLLAGPDEWEGALIRLVSDAALRCQLAATARAGVQRKWLLSNRAGEWAEFYATVRAAPMDGARAKLAVALETLLELHVLQQEQALRRLESELRQMRESITWRSTEPIRRAFARWQRLTRSGSSRARSR